jgi:hypothetical protein
MFQIIVVVVVVAAAAAVGRTYYLSTDLSVKNLSDII